MHSKIYYLIYKFKQPLNFINFKFTCFDNLWKPSDSGHTIAAYYQNTHEMLPEFLCGLTLLSPSIPLTSLPILVARPSATDGDGEITVTLSDAPKLMEWPILPDDVHIPNGDFLSGILNAISFLFFRGF